MAQFRDTLKRLMAERGLSMTELARRSGVSRPVISAYLSESKKGKLPGYGSLLALAKALGCSLDELTGTAPFDKKVFLANKLSTLLSQHQKTQVALAKFAGIKQGHLADHLNVSKKSYPKIDLLMKYARFFGVSLYELSGQVEFKDLESVAGPRLRQDQEALLNAYNALPVGSEQREIIDLIVQQVNRKNIRDSREPR